MGIKTSLPPYKLLNTTTGPDYRTSECAFFYYNNWALMCWVLASVSCFLALLSTIYTIYSAYKLWSTIQDLENNVIDLIDDACLILLPLGVCKQICHPHHIGTVNANYLPKGHKDEQQKPGKKENRYPEDVTFPPSDIEKVYDMMGDEDNRKSKTITLSTVRELVPEDAQETQKSSGGTNGGPSVKQPSRELPLQKTPVMSRETVVSSDPKKTLTPIGTKAKETPSQKTPSREKPTIASREPMTAKSKSGKSTRRSGKKKEASKETAPSVETAELPLPPPPSLPQPPPTTPPKPKMSSEASEQPQT